MAAETVSGRCGLRVETTGLSHGITESRYTAQQKAQAGKRQTRAMYPSRPIDEEYVTLDVGRKLKVATLRGFKYNSHFWLMFWSHVKKE